MVAFRTYTKPERLVLEQLVLVDELAAHDERLHHVVDAVLDVIDPPPAA
jgi:hypothetical protein